jgi:hypothetical protein
MNLTIRCVAPVICTGVLLLWGGQALAQDAAFNQAVNGAIDRGVANLRRLQGKDGTWARGDAKASTRETCGATALAGLTLLECGVAPDDKAVKRAADAVRKMAVAEKYVYSVSLCILFLDKLGDPQDEPFIDALATRLLAAQDRTRWAWSYYCPAPDAAEVARLTDVLKNRKELPGKPPGWKPRPQKDLPKAVMDQIVQIYRTPARPAAGDVDNSNTQFALLALWVTRRHGIPADFAIAKVESRLRATQRPHGGWTYRYPDKVLDEGMFQSPDFQPSPQMTCSGLLGMALAHGILDPKKALKYDLANDPAVKLGFLALGSFVGNATGDVSKATKLTRPGKAYYFLWSLERMAVLYDLKTIGGKDWYRWGAEILLANQGPDGGWHGEYDRGGCDTCFALLFLKRTNVARDLTQLLLGKGKDPGKTPPKLLEMIEKEFAPGIEKKPGSRQAPPGRQGSAAPLGDPALGSAARRFPLGGFCARLAVTHSGLASGDCGGGAGAGATCFFIVRTTLP